MRSYGLKVRSAVNTTLLQGRPLGVVEAFNAAEVLSRENPDIEVDAVNLKDGSILATFKNGAEITGSKL